MIRAALSKMDALGWPYIVIVLALAGNAELIADAVIGGLL